MKRFFMILLTAALALAAMHVSALADEPFPYTREQLGLPALDIQGDTVTYLTWDNQKTLDADAANILMQQIYGCKIRVIRTTWSEIAQKAASMVLSGNTPDLITYRAQEFPTFIQSGVVADVTAYLDFDDPLWADVRDAADVYKYQGRYYVFPYSTIFNNSVIYYWTSYFEDLALDTPLELYQNGDWTLDALKDLMKELTLDDDRDGIIDVYGLVLHPDNTFLSCGEDYVVLDQETGLFSNNLRAPALATYFDFLYDTGTAGNDTRLMSLESNSCFAAKNAVMLWDERWMMGSSYYDALVSGEMGFAPSPILEEGGGYYVNGRIGQYWIGKGCANLTGAVAYMACQRVLDKTEGLAEEIRRWAGLKSRALPEDMKALLREMDDPAKFTALLPLSRGVGDWGQSGHGVLDLYSRAAQFENPWQTLVEEYYPILQEQINITNQKGGVQ